jgi:hypothetical protein
MSIIQELQRDYILKGIGEPRYYLGGDILELGPEWSKGESPITTALSAEKYIENAVAKYEQLFSTPEQAFSLRLVNAPSDSTYHP